MIKQILLGLGLMSLLLGGLVALVAFVHFIFVMYWSVHISWGFSFLVATVGIFIFSVSYFLGGVVKARLNGK